MYLQKIRATEKGRKAECGGWQGKRSPEIAAFPFWSALVTPLESDFNHTTSASFFCDIPINSYGLPEVMAFTHCLKRGHHEQNTMIWRKGV